ncbi:MAG: 50S ribosomal protein L17 [Fimbriimonadaceae bacterium]|jgi:large subunit ribosomal protein L17|nr:50S ribosomal protein L17 [Fimbriimonadaceae bacterium]
MRHKVDRRKLGLPSDQRMALLTNLQRQFIRHGYIRTTLGRAKEVQRLVEKLITLTKMEDGLEARRRARRVLVGHSSSSPKPEKALAGKTASERVEILQQRSLINGEDLVKHLFDEVGPRFKDRPGGYTRLTKLAPRRGDAATQAVLELVD